VPRDFLALRKSFSVNNLIFQTVEEGLEDTTPDEMRLYKWYIYNPEGRPSILPTAALRNRRMKRLQPLRRSEKKNKNSNANKKKMFSGCRHF
jgi:hypothetical protein